MIHLKTDNVFTKVISPDAHAHEIIKQALNYRVENFHIIKQKKLDKAYEEEKSERYINWIKKWNGNKIFLRQKEQRYF